MNNTSPLKLDFDDIENKNDDIYQYTLAFDSPYTEIGYLLNNHIDDLNEKSVIIVPDEQYKHLLLTIANNNGINFKEINSNIFGFSLLTFLGNFIDCLKSSSKFFQEDFYYKYSNLLCCDLITFFAEINAIKSSNHESTNNIKFETITTLLTQIIDITQLNEYINQQSKNKYVIESKICFFDEQAISKCEYKYILGINNQYDYNLLENALYCSSAKVNLQLKKVLLPSFVKTKEITRKTSNSNYLPEPLNEINISPNVINTITATSIESLAKCPYKFLNSQILKVGSKTHIYNEDLMPANEIGNVVHKILDRLISNKITEVDIHQEVFSIVNNYFKETGKESKLKTKLNSEKILLTINSALDDLKNSNISKSISEYKIEEFKIKTPNAEINIKGKVDRVDFSENKIEIIDYKTGKKSEKTGKDFFRLGRRTQLGIYALALLNVHRVTSINYLYIDEESRYQDRYNLNTEFINDFSNRLNGLLEPLSSGIFPPRTTFTSSTRQKTQKDNCSYCDYKLICNLETKQTWHIVKSSEKLKNYINETEAI